MSNTEKKGRYIVLCRSDWGDGFEYIPSTRNIFDEDGAKKYAATINVNRHPRIIDVTDYLVGFEGWHHRI